MAVVVPPTYAASIAQPGTPQAESNAIRVTNRAERELARANDGEYTGIVRRLLAEAPDAATRGVLAQELPTLAGVEPEFIRSTLIETDPAASSAAQVLRDAQASQMIIDADAQRLRNAINEGHAPLVGLTDPAKYDPDRK